MRGGLALAPLTLALLLASDIKADQHPPLTVGAGPHLELVTVAARANTEGVQVVQVIINHAGHIDAVVPHPFVMLLLHVDCDVLDVVLQGRPSYALHSSSKDILPSLMSSGWSSQTWMHRRFHSLSRDGFPIPLPTSVPHLTQI